MAVLEILAQKPYVAQRLDVYRAAGVKTTIVI
jgi:hypothetical protein